MVGQVIPRHPGSCDTHIHVYDGRYPASSTTVLRPPDASIADYRNVQGELGINRVVMVQPTTYGLDNSCQLDAVAAFGDDARAVVVVDDTATQTDLEQLHARGARGARFHMLPGGAVPWSCLPVVAERIASLGWHIQLQLNGRELPDRIDTLRRLPTPIVVDHIGRFMPPVPTDDAAFDALRSLVDTGRCWVKLSAPYESTHDGAPRYPTVTALAHALIEHAPERILWASNWPHPGQAAPITTDDIRQLVIDWMPDDAIRHRVMVANPAEVYGFEPVHRASNHTPSSHNQEPA